MPYIVGMISALSGFYPLPILPALRLRGAGAAPSEELSKALRAKETTSARNATAPLPLGVNLPYVSPEKPEVQAQPDSVIQNRFKRYTRDDATGAQSQTEPTQAPGLFSFGLPAAGGQAATLASVSPVQTKLDSASFVSLYASNDAFPAATEQERFAQPYLQASRALVSSFSFGEELALNVAA